MKIVIIGSPGSGKSTLAQELHKKLKIPLYHLDQYFWKPGWTASDYSEFEKIHNQLCDKNSWIIEGCAIRLIEYRIQQADIIIFLDISRSICLFRTLKRAYQYYDTVYFSSAPGCPERVPSLKFLHYIIQKFPQHKQNIYTLLKAYTNNSQKKVFIATNNRQLQTIKDTL